MSKFTYPVTRPHEDQDGYRYIRVAARGLLSSGMYYRSSSSTAAIGTRTRFYADYHPDQRVISSRKVEDAVETMDYLRLCRERGWIVHFGPAAVVIYSSSSVVLSCESSLRRAYIKATRPEDIPEPFDFDDAYYRNCDFEPEDAPGVSERAAGVEPLRDQAAALRRRRFPQ